MLPDRIAFIDLETTGADPTRDRITEIGIVTVDGDSVSRWSTLVNPERAIPPFIQRLTGIRDDMVAAAPPFDQVAAELARRREGRLFVAHNARFDYGFVRHEYRRLGRRFQSEVLCTVRLSRRLCP
jgi:DNA polymerase-3 subunit epsilon